MAAIMLKANTAPNSSTLRECMLTCESTEDREARLCDLSACQRERLSIESLEQTAARVCQMNILLIEQQRSHQTETEPSAQLVRQPY